MRHGVDSEPAAPLQLTADLIGASIAPEQALDLGLVQSRLGGAIGEHATVPDVPALDEVGSEERLDDRVLAALSTGVPDQAVSIERVRCPDDPVEAKRDSQSLPDRGQRASSSSDRSQLPNFAVR